MKIIFLDVDGVLNSTLWNKENQKEINDERLIDEAKVQQLAQIVKNTGAKIVLHSGWRFGFDEMLNPVQNEAKYLVSILEQNDLKIYDKTPDLTNEEVRITKKFSLVKAQEILLWLENHKNIERYIVLEDIDLNNDVIRDRVILTDFMIGLSEENVLDAINLLNQ